MDFPDARFRCNGGSGSGEYAVDDTVEIAADDAAAEDFAAAGTYPENLEVAKGTGGGQNAKIFYFLGTSREARGDQEGRKPRLSSLPPKRTLRRKLPVNSPGSRLPP